jgi:hypothetical protein
MRKGETNRQEKTRLEGIYFRRARSIAANAKKPQVHAPDMTNPNHTLK